LKLVLVVDDEEDTRPLFEQRFRKQIASGDVRFEFVHSGEQALEKLSQHNAESVLVLSDIRMPGLDGFQLLEAIRNQPNAPPVYLVTAYHQQQYVERAEQLGASGYMTKPIDFEQLQKLISRTVQTVSVLITDLVGSTKLESRVGPVVADQLRFEYFGLLRGAIEEAGGREVKNTGDGLIAVFDSAGSAVTAAVAIQQRFERRNRSARERMMVKVGLSAGDATVEEGDYFGMPLIEAARLCDKCTGGQILAKQLVSLLAAGRGHEFTSVGGLELKGLPEPLESVEVVWKRQAEGWLLPLPSRLAEMPSRGMVGRTAESERFSELMGEVTRGERRLVLLSGEAGIGKTRLATHEAHQARSNGAVVLFGTCKEELTVPYGPWVDALTHLVEHAPEELLREHVERHGGELGRLVPALRTRLPDAPPERETDPETERYLFWGAVAGILRVASRQDPLVLILDDLHWADKPSLLLLKHTLAQGHDTRVLIIGTYRDSDLHRGHPLTSVLADLHREQGVERLSLSGLGQPEIVELMERAAGHGLSDTGLELSQELLRETDGNPFYTTELLRHLTESGAIYQKPNGRFAIRGRLADLGLPQSVREVLDRRVERLGENIHKVLTVASVIGREFDLDLLAAVTERTDDDVLELLEAATDASVVSESASAPGKFSFAHALINHTLYEAIGITRRARLHRRVAEALEDVLGEQPGVRVGELAYHWAKAVTPTDLDKTIRYARLAGQRALAELAPDEALRWFNQAFELMGDGGAQDDRCELLIGLGEAQRQTGDAAYRQTLLDASRLAGQIADADRAARAALANSRGHASVFGEIDQERLDALQLALDLDDFANPARCARLLSVRSVELQFERDHRPRREIAEQALSLAREVGDPATLAQVLSNYIHANWAPDTTADRIRLADELAEVAKAAKDPALECWAAWVAHNVQIESGNFEAAAEARTRMDTIAERLGQPSMKWFAGFPAAGWEIMRGDFERAEQLGNSAFQTGTEAGQPDAFMMFGAQISQIMCYRGKAGDLIGLVEEHARSNPGIPAWQASLAGAYCWVDRFDEAKAEIELGAADRFQHIPWDQIRMSALAMWTLAVSWAQVPAAAEIIYELMEPWSDQVVWNADTGYGHAQMWMGMLAATMGRDEVADRHFAFANDFHHKTGLLLFAAHGHFEWARALKARGHHVLAEQEAARAIELSRERGYGGIEALANAIVHSEATTGA
jgi:class 3 adenylate cyclase